MASAIQLYMNFHPGSEVTIYSSFSRMSRLGHRRSGSKKASTPLRSSTAATPSAWSTSPRPSESTSIDRSAPEERRRASELESRLRSCEMRHEDELRKLKDG